MKVGDRVRMLEMPNDPDPIPPGTEGVVQETRRVCLNPRNTFTQYEIKWDNGRTLSAIVPPDKLEVIS